jgi:hypothetical protein
VSWISPACFASASHYFKLQFVGRGFRLSAAREARGSSDGKGLTGADGKSRTGLDYRDCDKRGTANFAQRCRKKMMRKGLRLRLRCRKPGSASLRDYLSIGHKCK